MPIWSLPIVSVFFGVGLLLVSFYIFKIAMGERSKRIVAISVVLVLIGIGLILLGIWMLERYGLSFLRA